MSDASGKRARESSSLRQPAPQQGASSRGGATKPGSEVVQRLRAQQAAQAQKLAQVTECCCYLPSQHLIRRAVCRAIPRHPGLWPVWGLQCALGALCALCVLRAVHLCASLSPDVLAWTAAGKAFPVVSS